MAYRLSPALVQLRSEVNDRWPNRDNGSDGWIGDAAHRDRISDHNPDEDGSVNALDVDRDGIEVSTLLNAAMSDHRTSYVIYAGLIFRAVNRFKPVRYTGNNPHNHHVHVSIRHGRVYEDDRTSWGLNPAPAAARPSPTTAAPTQEEDPMILFRSPTGGVIFVHTGKAIRVASATVYASYAAAGVRTVQLEATDFAEACRTFGLVPA